jgi:asparagine synthase (glutamine-hydrolysing)
LDVSALRTYLEAGYIPAPASIYESIRKLPPGHYLMLSAEGELTVKQYWDFRHIAPEPSWNQRREGDLLDELDEILTRSVRLRMVSDAPVGAFLSGGIDSSLIVAKMASFSSRPPTSLTIGFRESDFDESSAAERVARHLGTEHYSAIMQVDDLLELMPHFLSEFDEPCFDYSYFPTMAVSRLARQHVTVSLSGDGGDELFGGYHYYQIARSLAPVFALPSAVRRGLSNLVRQVPSNGFQLLSAAMRQSNSVAAFAFTRSIAKDFQLPIAPELLHSTRALSELFEETASTFPLGICSAEQAMRLDLSYTLPDDYLHKLDRSSMAFSLESREPLLDQDLVEWCMKLPIHWKLRGLTNKYLLRKLLYRYVPRKLVDRPKMGFGVPMAQWLRGPLKTFAMERFTTSRLFERVPIDQKKVLELYDLHLSGKRNVAPLIWALLALLDQLSRD